MRTYAIYTHTQHTQGEGQFVETYKWSSGQPESWDSRSERHANQHGDG